MKYKRFGEDIVARLEVGEEVVSSVAEIAEREGVTFASIQGIGAADEFVVSVYDVKEKRYYDNEFKEPLEMTGLSGTVTERDGAPYIHIHATAGRRDGSVVGGHLRRAVVSATCELVLHTVYGTVPRFSDAETSAEILTIREGADVKCPLLLCAAAEWDENGGRGELFVWCLGGREGRRIRGKCVGEKR